MVHRKVHVSPSKIIVQKQFTNSKSDSVGQNYSSQTPTIAWKESRVDKVKLIHWKAEELEEREAALKSAGFLVDSDLKGGTAIIQQLASEPPAAIIIDLSRLPSQGRDFALLVRKRKATRQIPLIFVAGDAEKVNQVKLLLPDARYTSWAQITHTLQEAIQNPVENPLVHDSTFAGYAGKPLVEKLGIKPGMKIVIINEPADFIENLEFMPAGVQIENKMIQDCDLSIWFSRTSEELERQIIQIMVQSKSSPVWIAWPKQKSSASKDLTQQTVRKIGLANGLVDYKICSFDETWTGLLFKFRGN